MCIISRRPHTVENDILTERSALWDSTGQKQLVTAQDREDTNAQLRQKFKAVHLDPDEADKSGQGRAAGTARAQGTGRNPNNKQVVKDRKAKTDNIALEATADTLAEKVTVYMQGIDKWSGRGCGCCRTEGRGRLNGKDRQNGIFFFFSFFLHMLGHILI